ncbi:hypothetical protein MSAN_00857100 [Mycena sanguinolenta]|uniref:Uncharacterized protein n=1 Tax=Mycena sanguinolenta TaxID=230812 RepID=A0A8H6YZ95_9AGAR|nr:hypothetical protein MSAN_00857100 [Mycena sanguinolenta]
MLSDSSWLRSLTISRRRIVLLLLAGGLIFVFSIYLEWSGYTNLTSLPWPTLSPSPADLSPSDSLSDIFFPGGLPEEDHSWMAENDRTIASLFRCVEQGNCRNQTKVVILAGGPFRGVLRGDNGGEAIWANSTIIALQRLGYSFLYSSSRERTSHLYSMFRNLVIAIFADVPDVKACFHDHDCVRVERNLRGIPAWKLFSFHFWSSADNPLGRKWTLSPELVSDIIHVEAVTDHSLDAVERYCILGVSHSMPLADQSPDSYNTYLGYSIEPQCAHQTHIPFDVRPAQAFVYSKHVQNFNGSKYAWAPDFFDEASAAAGVEFIAGVHGTDLPEFFPSNITNVGFMAQADFYSVVANSRVVIGVGRPVTHVLSRFSVSHFGSTKSGHRSPTPYEALCFGVPFINPILNWDRKNPTDRTRWDSQHDTLKYLDPPHVYNVFKDDKEGFINAVVQATSTPIESFVLPDMRISAIEARLGGILETDWKAEAAELLADRKASRVGETFWL